MLDQHPVARIGLRGPRVRSLERAVRAARIFEQAAALVQEERLPDASQEQQGHRARVDQPEVGRGRVTGHDQQPDHDRGERQPRGELRDARQGGPPGELSHESTNTDAA